ncbi:MULTISPECIES: DUF5320 family protein [unclassified Oceanispirochaeta]|uniref:DUF5320 family protein n=1 Tax=unclassified Oceanispirochaeta TaxID=2635722 RepID=UPI000E092A4F|nr:MULTISPECIES: DUF5320 family protein [unclassified Oceanispirochaeta]MBF9018207.1 DUF5320 domain-containing protein [Oceanispirochaeta sp. M2]NPD74687.1 DUF5320 domain-containing protein [Oceanispirochaeta sp. M1]RDG29479.1 hypothetical protein DV872_21525 [Oceanispirochaeta sp. M1]
MNKNGMGPQNSGPLTGRGMGNCNKDSLSNTTNAGFAGRGMGRGNGMGRGMGRGMAVQGMQAESALMMRIEALEAEIQALKGNK